MCERADIIFSESIADTITQPLIILGSNMGDTKLGTLNIGLICRGRGIDIVIVKAIVIIRAAE